MRVLLYTATLGFRHQRTEAASLAFAVGFVLVWYLVLDLLYRRGVVIRI